MPLPIAILNELVSIKRRVSLGVDSLGNPIYGQPTQGQGWQTVYTNVPCKLAFNSKMIQFAPEGERVTPSGVMYFNNGFTILPEDRVLVSRTSGFIEYNVVSIVPGYIFGTVVDHFEAILQLP